MKVIYKGVGALPERVELPDTARALQASVGGHIETHKIATNAAVVCNAQGAINGMPYNCTFLGQDWYGPVLIVGSRGEEFCSLPDGSFIFLEAMLRRE